MDEQTADYDVKAVGWGLIYTPLCIRKDIDPHEAAAIFTTREPPGTSYNRWEYVEPADLDEKAWHDPATPEADRIYPTPCGDNHETHVHILVNC